MDILLDAVLTIKRMIEEAILEGGVAGKNNVIRSQRPICVLHDLVKRDLINKGVNRNYIHPILGQHNGELKLNGFFKSKDQDICVCPNNVHAQREIMQFEGILQGNTDIYGKQFTERILSINVRSQLSSVAKNFDTLYERSFAEPLNLHLRCPEMVLGEFYMIPVWEYDDKLAEQHRIGWKSNRNVKKHIEKYIRAFKAISNRNGVNDKTYKYERTCLLIVDFQQDIPVIYHNDADLLSDNLISRNCTASINNMNFPTFTDSLLDCYSERFGPDRFR